jgi:nucleoside-diphosphate-sugar epimerase
MITIEITGSTGFVGNALTTALNKFRVHRALRQTALDPLPGDAIVGDIGPDTDWRAALIGVDCVVHLAARTHVLQETAHDSLAAFRHINVDGTRRLAEQAAATGVRRFVFLSSIKVNGEANVEHAFTETDAPAPEDAYGISKREAEDVLREISARTGMEVVILRPPLVYGPGVKGNFLRLLHAIDCGLPLPLGSVKNRRSLIHVANLADAIVACIDAPAAANQTFLVSDGEDLSTPELIRQLAVGMGKSAWLLPCPVALLEMGAAMVGQRAAVARLTGTLAVDETKLRLTLGWHPRIPLDQGLIDTARWYHRARIQRQT